MTKLWPALLSFKSKTLESSVMKLSAKFFRQICKMFWKSQQRENNWKENCMYLPSAAQQDTMLEMTSWDEHVCVCSKITFMMFSWNLLLQWECVFMFFAFMHNSLNQNRLNVNNGENSQHLGKVLNVLAHSHLCILPFS